LDDVLSPIHGGPDGGPEPLYDFSTNANALGPNPIILEYLQSVVPSRYPDPLYRETHPLLAQAHGVAEVQVAVGTGTSELIHRLSRWNYLRGPILLLPPTFSEYARAARALDLPLWEARSPEEFLELLPRSSLAFLCIPNNPTGEVYPSWRRRPGGPGGPWSWTWPTTSSWKNPLPSPRGYGASTAQTRPTASPGCGRGTWWPPWTSPTSGTWPLAGPYPPTGRPSSGGSWTLGPGPGWSGAGRAPPPEAAFGRGA